MQTIVIDGRRWDVEFAGFSAPLRARISSSDGATPKPGGTRSLSLLPWTYADHLHALREHLLVGPVRLELDTEGYANAVLDLATMQTTTQHSDREGRAASGERRALALWWASGVEPGELVSTDPLEPARDGFVSLGGGCSAKLRGWTWGERLSASHRHLRYEQVDSEGEAKDGALDFDPVSYLETMVETCVLDLASRTGARPRLADLDARATRQLLAAVTATNYPEEQDDPLADISPELAAATLRLCSTLGWTPERVLATPAAEVQRMLRLLEKTEDKPRRGARVAQRHLSLSDHPDAVVLVFGDEEQS